MIGADATEHPAVLTAEEVAAILRISRWQTYELAKSGRLPSLRLGRSLRFPRRGVLELLGELEPPAPPSPADAQADVVELRRGGER